MDHMEEQMRVLAKKLYDLEEIHRDYHETLKNKDDMDHSAYEHELKKILMTYGNLIVETSVALRKRLGAK